MINKYILATIIVISILGMVQYVGEDTPRVPVLAQTYSTKCATPVSICYVPAQPVGSRCTCNGVEGAIVP